MAVRNLDHAVWQQAFTAFRQSPGIFKAICANAGITAIEPLLNAITAGSYNDFTAGLTDTIVAAFEVQLAQFAAPGEAEEPEIEAAPPVDVAQIQERLLVQATMLDRTEKALRNAERTIDDLNEELKEKEGELTVRTRKLAQREAAHKQQKQDKEQHETELVIELESLRLAVTTLTAEKKAAQTKLADELTFARKLNEELQETQEQLQEAKDALEATKKAETEALAKAAASAIPVQSDTEKSALNELKVLRLSLDAHIEAIGRVQEKNEAQLAQIEALNQTIAHLTEQLQEAHAQATAIPLGSQMENARVPELERELASTKARIRELETDLLQRTQTVTELERRIAKLPDPVLTTSKITTLESERDAALAAAEAERMKSVAASQANETLIKLVTKRTTERGEVVAQLHALEDQFSLSQTTEAALLHRAEAAEAALQQARLQIIQLQQALSAQDADDVASVVSDDGIFYDAVTELNNDDTLCSAPVRQDPLTRSLQSILVPFHLQALFHQKDREQAGLTWLGNQIHTQIILDNQPLNAIVSRDTERFTKEADAQAFMNQPAPAASLSSHLVQIRFTRENIGKAIHITRDEVFTGSGNEYSDFRMTFEKAVLERRGIDWQNISWQTLVDYGAVVLGGFDRRKHFEELNERLVRALLDAEENSPERCAARKAEEASLALARELAGNVPQAFTGAGAANQAQRVLEQRAAADDRRR